MQASSELDIAIIGMSGRFPGADNVDEFWNNLAGGVESISRLSDDEILASGVPGSYLREPAYVKAAPVLNRPDHFDAGFFGYSPMEARTMDPQQRIMLELAYEALEHAGWDTDRFQGRVGVFTGSALNTYYTSAGLDGRLTGDYIPTLIGNDKDFLSTRISYKLNLKGPSITVQTACSTSMVAVHLACQSLLSEESDMALAGGVSVRVPQRAGYFCDGGGVVSADGHVRAFDAGANGTVFGSGGGVLVLKRMADAIEDGDTIHAVIKGSAVNNDGAAKAGYTAPSVDAQADAVVEALANAGVEADSIGYVEAHGSGTPVGDPIEVAALTKAFRNFTRRSGYCALGSVKTNVGHLDAAAAVTGIIKTVLALKHRKLPASLHYSKANPEIDFSQTPFFVNARLAEWAGDGPRRAGVMSTGMGGTNAHLVLEEAPQPEADGEDTGPRLLVWSAKTPTALESVTRRLRDFLRAGAPASMGDVAHTLQAGRRAYAHRSFLACSDRDDAAAAFDEAKRIVSGRIGESRRPIAFLLPGIGDHYVGMAHGLYEGWPEFRAEVDRCAGILSPQLGADIRDIIYPPGERWRSEGGRKGIDMKKMLGGGAGTSDDPDAARLNRTHFAQPAQFTIEYAMSRAWQSLGIIPDAIVGHSMGEYVAACLAGVMSLEDALKLIARRAKLVSDLPPGAMIAVAMPESDLSPLLPDELSISLINGPALCVVAGPVDAVSRFKKELDDRDIIYRHVQNAHAFHSKMLDPVAKAFEKEVRGIRLEAPAIPFTSNVTGTWITPGDATRPGYWAEHACRTARFGDALASLWRMKNPVLLEAGPGRTLGVLAMQHPGRRDAGDPVAVSSIRHDYENQPDMEHVYQAAGRMWLTGADVHFDRLPSAGRRRRVPLPTYPFERVRHWLEPASAADTETRGSQGIHKIPDPARWLYLPSWKRLLPRTVDSGAGRSNQESSSWLVFADEQGFAAGLADRLARAGHDVVTVQAGGGFEQAGAHTFHVDPADPRHYHRLVGALKSNERLPHRIVHAWSVGGPRSADEESFRRAQDSGFYSLLFLTRAYAAHNVRRELRLWVISDEVQDVTGGERLAPGKSTVLGPCMVIHQEYPNISVQSIDLEMLDNESARGVAADRLLGELLNPDQSLFVAHRNGRRWVETYEPITTSGRDTGHTSFREGGVYLITGGLGRVGVTISRYLAKKYKARLVLIGRSALPDRDAWNDELKTRAEDDPVRAKIAAIREIENLGGEVLYQSAEVSNADALRHAVDRACDHFGALDGVIHGAGIVGDSGYREIKSSDQAACDAHFRAKANGLLALEKALDGRAPDFCLLLSSLSSVLGGIGQAAYASSNIYMDAFARSRNQTSPGRWLSVNWDVWRLGDDEAFGSVLGATLKDLGMNADEAIRMMETALALRSASQLVVSTGDLDARIDQWVKLESLGSKSEYAEVGTPARGQRPELSTPFDAPRDEVEKQVVEVWQKALGFDGVGINDRFADLGGHSLLAVKIVTELRKQFQVDLPLRALFDAPTVAELSRYLEALAWSSESEQANESTDEREEIEI